MTTKWNERVHEGAEIVRAAVERVAPNVRCEMNGFRWFLRDIIDVKLEREAGN
jgi:hypothetical protein